MKLYLSLVCLLIVLISCKPPLREAETLLQDEKYKSAENVLLKLIAKDENTTQAQILLGQALFYTRGPEDAFTHLGELYAQHQDDKNFQRVIKTLKQELSEVDQLIRKGTESERLAYLEKNKPDWLKDRIRWVLIQHKQGKFNTKDIEDPLTQQLITWYQAGQNPEKLNALLDEFPKSELRPAWHQALFDSYKKDKNESQAIEQLRQAEKEQPERSLSQAHFLLQRADYEFEAEQIGAALQDYRQFLKFFPDHPAGRQTIYKLRTDLAFYLKTSDHRFLAEQAFLREMYQTAHAELVQVPAETAQEIYRLGNYALKAKEVTSAREQFSRLQKYFKGTREAGLASVGLASIQRMNKAYPSALQLLDAVKRAYASIPEVLAAALWEQGIVYDFQNRNDLRAAAYGKLIATDPSFEDAISALWYALWHEYQHGNYQKVVDLVDTYRKYFTKHELKSRLQYWQARSYEQLNDRKAAQTIYLELQKKPLMDYYAHRSRERLRVIERGGEDRYATTAYQGFTRSRIPDPGYAEAFEHLLKGERNGLSELMQLYYLRHPAFMALAEHAEQPQYQVLYGLMQHTKGHYYEAIRHYRYPAEKDNVYLPVAFPLAYFDKIEAEAKKNGLNPFLVAGQIWQESQYQPGVKSWVGATGLMQIMPATGEQIAGELGLEDYTLTDPADNIKMGTWYLKSRHEVFDGNPLFAVASYNAGAGPVLKWKKQFGNLPYDALAESIPYPETRGYVKRVFTSYWIYQALYGK